MKFKSGDRVTYVIDSKVCNGVIEYVINDRLAIVISDDGSKYKVFLEFLAPEPTVEKTEPIEKPEITITPEEFRKAVIMAILELDHISPSFRDDIPLFVAELHKALFFGEVNENP